MLSAAAVGVAALGRPHRCQMGTVCVYLRVCLPVLALCPSQKLDTQTAAQFTFLSGQTFGFISHKHARKRTNERTSKMQPEVVAFYRATLNCVRAHGRFHGQETRVPCSEASARLVSATSCGLSSAILVRDAILYEYFAPAAR